ncbi:MAG TPA: hypothetical protein VFH27_01100 [Longimicrobiaceae bacterium]|nr:hypothetical protein [Longimicrobiaceae bacterium]
MQGMRQLRDETGTWWAASEGYTWSPMRQKEPVSYVVFRAAGRELRADGVPRLDAMADGDLIALLGALQTGGDSGDRASTHPPRAGARRRTLLRGTFGLGVLGI